LVNNKTLILSRCTLCIWNKNVCTSLHKDLPSFLPLYGRWLA